MGAHLEMAELRGTGLSAETVAERTAEADRSAGALATAGFWGALDAAPAPPAPAAAERVVVLGIGGSALGTRVVHDVCRRAGLRRIEVVDNIDPQALERAWAGGDPARTAWVVVSKSGGTTETLAQCAVVRERLSARGGWRGVHVVTGPKGPLRDLAVADGLPVHTIPAEVGGRFSVFTPAATVPLALAGHDVGALLAGARAARAHCLAPGSAAARLAALLVAAHDTGRNVVTLWSYGERLASLGEWFRQLWAESLGKLREDGARVGQTPLSCVGSTDQHSIQQLMVEGPRDKVVLVLTGPVEAGPTVPEGFAGAGAGHSLGSILDAMRRATSAAMVRAGAPAATLRLEQWSEESLGSLLMVLLAATVLAGRLLGVDPFGQPGVEAAKLATRKLLAEPGGEESAAIARLLGEGGGIRIP